MNTTDSHIKVKWQVIAQLQTNTEEIHTPTDHISIQHMVVKMSYKSIFDIIIDPQQQLYPKQGGIPKNKWTFLHSIPRELWSIKQ